MTTKKEPKPLYDKVIVYRHEKEGKSAGGIVLTDTNDGKPCFGTVIAVGPGKLLIDGKLAPLQVKKGDTIVFPRHVGVEIEAGDKTVIVMREEEILAVV